MNEVEFKCKGCGYHWSVQCRDVEAVIDLSREKGCPFCQEPIRPKTVNGKYYMTDRDFMSLYRAGMIKFVEF